MNDPVDYHQLEELGNILKRKKATVAIAESVTAGLLQFSLSRIKDSREIFQGGISTYNIAQKYKHLSVEPIHALKVMGVSDKVVREMAEGVSRLFCSSWGIAVSGFASPIPESGFKIFAFYAFSRNGKAIKTGKIELTETPGAVYQVIYTKLILEEFKAMLTKI